MGKIKDKLIDIEDYLVRGYRPESVAAMLNVPLDWVWQVYKTLGMNDESRIEEANQA